MKERNKKDGFSLTEILIAIAALAVGMLLVAGAFPVAIHFAARSAEQFVSTAVADEAFAKIKLYAEGDPNSAEDDINLGALDSISMKPYKIIEIEPPGIDVYLEDINDILPALNIVDVNMPDVFAYPSDESDLRRKHYYWAPMFRRVGENSRLVQVTVFVCRKQNLNTNFYWPAYENQIPLPRQRNEGKVNIGNPAFGPWPEPVKVDLQIGPRMNEMIIQTSINELPSVPTTRRFINSGSFIVDDRTGSIYRVLKRYKPTQADPQLGRRIKLDRNWQETVPPAPQPFSVWVVPPPAQGGKSPCVGVFQKLIRF